MNKKPLYIAFTALFIALLAIPVWLSPFFGTGTGKAPSPVNSEGRFDYGFAAKADEYLSDRMSAGKWLITAYSGAVETLLHTSVKDKVIVGRDGWLFYADTLDDYTGRSAPRNGELEMLCRTLELVNEYVTSTGGSFVFIAAPNKNTVYPEYMPLNYTQGSDSFLTALDAAMAGKSYYLSLSTALRDAGVQTYHKKDTHWNSLGAAVAYRMTAEALSRRYTDYMSVGYTLREDHDGDLSAMLMPAWRRPDTQAYFNTVRGFSYKGNFRSTDDLIIETQGDGEGSLLLFRDSFGVALYPLMAGDFAEAYISRVVPYRLDLLATAPRDAVVIEIAERNLRNLLYEAPVIPAPKRNAPEEAAELRTDGIKTEVVRGLTHITGSTGDFYGAVYLRIEASDGTFYFEACPQLDADSSACGFSAYIDIPSDSIKGIAVLGSRYR